MKKAQAYGYAKLILFGEHSVVYNRPALAIPYPSLKVEAILEESKEKLFYLDSLCFKGYLQHVPKSLEGLRDLIERVFTILNKSMRNLRLNIQSEIPLQRGLGSSAAVATATVRAIFAYFEEPLSDERLLELVDFSEGIYHLNPSGLDARTIVSEKVTWYQKDRGFSYLDNIALPEGLLLVDSGILGETSEAVSIVAQVREEEPLLFEEMMDQLEKAALDGTRALLAEDADAVAIAMRLAHQALDALGVGHPELDLLSRKLYEYGANGVKMSGAGLGGCLIAIFDHHDEVLKAQERLKEAGYDAWSIEKEWFNEQNSARQQQHRADQVLG